MTREGVGPKIAACVRFVTATNNSAAIGSLNDAAAILAGTAGTTVIADGDETHPRDRT